MMAEAERNDLDALTECGELSDSDAVPLALYAAERLVGGETDGRAVEYVLRRASAPQSTCGDPCTRRWRSLNEALLLKSLLQRIGGAAAAAPLRALEAEIENDRQIATLVHDPEDHVGKLQQAARPAPGDLSWVGYGEEPWLLTLVSPTSFAPPVVLVVSSRRVVPDGVTLRTAPTDGTAPLGDGFVGLYAHWPPGHFADASAAPGALYSVMLVSVLGAALLAGYLLLRDVHRETETAAMRSNFVASVSHELKTPLTSIRAHAETLMMGRAATAETTCDYLRTIVNESERLTRLVDSVLDFSRIEQGRKTYHLQETSLDDVVRSAAKAMEYPLSQLGFTLTISGDGTAPIVSADPEALTQAILNLLGNAMKYSGDAREIEMRLGTREHEAFVDIVDHGIGIAPTDQVRIFERFHRVQSVETTGIAGTGLGLTLARHVVEAHQGRIALVSEPGLGSTFSVCIPLQAQA
jgi:signal transduction histidine kinase